MMLRTLVIHYGIIYMAQLTCKSHVTRCNHMYNLSMISSNQLTTFKICNYNAINKQHTNNFCNYNAINK